MSSESAWEGIPLHPGPETRNAPSIPVSEDRGFTARFDKTLALDPLDNSPELILDDINVPLGDYSKKASLWRIENEEIPVYLIDNAYYFGRENPYGHADDYERFIFFTRAIVEMLLKTEFVNQGWYPDIIHGHDWISGLLPMWLRHTYKDYFNSHPTAFVYTIHNAAFNSQCGYQAIRMAGLAELGIYQSIGENQQKVSFLGRGILAADAVNTVSEQHVYEIEQGEETRNLMKALAVSKKKMSGILNGLDYTIYNPAFDQLIPHKFDRDNLQIRQENKQLLQKECSLAVDPCAGYLAYPFQNQEVNGQEEDMIATHLMRECKEKNW